MLSLLSLSSSRFLSNLDFMRFGRSPNAHIPQVISKFSESLTVLTIYEEMEDYRDNVDDSILTLAAAIGSCHKLEFLDLHFANNEPEYQVLDLSRDALEEGLCTMLRSMKLKHVSLALGMEFELDSKNWVRVSHLLEAFSGAFSRILCSSLAKFETLDFYISWLDLEFLDSYWKIVEQRNQQSDHALVNLRSLHCRRCFMNGGDLSLLLKICPNLTSFSSNSTYDEMRRYAVAYLREHARGDKEKELNIEVLGVRESSYLEWIHLFDHVTAGVTCDVAERQGGWDKIHFRKRNAVLNIQIKI